MKKAFIGNIGYYYAIINAYYNGSDRVGGRVYVRIIYRNNFFHFLNSFE